MSLWLGIVASAGKKLLNYFLFGTNSGSLYTIDENNLVKQTSLSVPVVQDYINTGATWTTQNSNFGTTSIRSIAYGNGLWIAGGDLGQIRTSTNAITWTTATSFGVPPIFVGSGQYADTVRSIDYGQGFFIAAGNSGNIFRSTDSISWTSVTTISGNPNINEIAYGNGLWVGVGYGGLAIRSTNGITWTTQTSNFGSVRINSVAYGSGKWIAVGETSGSSGRETTDGITWTTSTLNTYSQTPRYIDYGGDTWIVGGTYSTIFTSTNNGSSWVVNSYGNFNSPPTYPSFVSSGSPGTITEISYGNGVWVGGATGSSTMIKTSTNLQTWTTVTTTSNIPTVIKYLNGSWLLIQQSDVFTSTDGLSWITRDVFSTSISDAVYANNLWVAAGNSGSIRISTDLQTWVGQDTRFAINTIATDNSKFLLGLNNNNIISTTDGISWITASSSMGNASVLSIAYGNGVWVASGTIGKNQTSTNGINWTTSASTSNNFVSSAYGNGLWVRISGFGELNTSTDGVTWATITSILYSNLSSNASIAYGNGIWVGSRAGLIGSSTDTITWTTRLSNFGNTAISKIHYGNGLWIAVGTNGQIRTSSDAITWNTVTSNFGATNITSISYGDDIWAAVGLSGQLRTSNQEYTSKINDIEYIPESKTILFSAEYGRLFSSTDLVSWTTINTGISGDIKVIKYGTDGNSNLYLAGG